MRNLCEVWIIRVQVLVDIHDRSSSVLHLKVNRFLLEKCVCVFNAKHEDWELQFLCNHNEALSSVWYTISFCLIPFLGFQTKIWKNWDHIENVLRGRKVMQWYQSCKYHQKWPKSSELNHHRKLKIMKGYARPVTNHRR